MTARGYELDDALRDVLTRLREMDIRINRNRPSTGISYTDSGGYYGGGTLTISDILDAIGAGTLPTSFLTVIGGGKGTVYPMGTLGASATVDLANGNWHWGTLDQDCTISFVGFTSLKDCQILLEIIEDGTGGWTPTLSGVTWIGGTPTWDTTAGTTTFVAVWSRDGGTTINAAVVGGATSTSGLTAITDGVVTVSSAATATVPLGGVADLGGGNADLRFLTSRYGGQPAVDPDTTVTGAKTIDCSLGNWFDFTLTGNATFTITNPPPIAGEIIVILRQGGAGSFTVTWPASVDWQDTDGTGGGAAPTLHTAVGAVNIISLATVDGGTTWGGADESSGGGGTPATTVEDETTFGITPAVGTDTEYARQDHTHGSPSLATLEASGHWEPLMDGGSPYAPLDDGTGTDWLFVWVP